MTLPARLRSIFEGLFHRRRVEAAMQAELKSHVEMYAEDLIRSGVPASEARRRARLEFGGIVTVEENCRRARSLQWVDDLCGDLRYSARMLRRNPGFAAVAILSLGLGIGANTAVFSLVNTVLLKLLPVHRPERLFFIDDSNGRSAGANAPPYPCLERFRQHDKYFSGMAAFNADFLKVTIDGRPERVAGQFASGNYFDVLGVRAVLGRTLKAVDDSIVGSGGPGGLVAVISYGFWKRRFGGSPAVLGKDIQVGTNRFTIVGVMPPEFFGLQVGQPVDLTIPMTASGNSLSQKASWWFSVVGRLRDGASPRQAGAELDAMFQVYMDELGMDGEMRKNYFDHVVLVPASKGLNELRRKFSKPLLTVMAIVGLVLLIGCANVANLLLARATARRTEISVRLAIGASKGRLMRQMLTEGLLLVAAGVACGLLFAGNGVSLLLSFLTRIERNPILLRPGFDLHVLGFTAVVAVLTGIVFSLAPAIQASRQEAVTTAGNARTTTRGKGTVQMSHALVIIQVALSLVLLCGAALFARTLYNLRTLDPGFARDGVLSMQVEATLPAVREATPRNPDLFLAESRKIAHMWTNVVGRVTVLPGVRFATACTLSPLGGHDRGVLIAIAGHPDLSEHDSNIHLNQVSPGYFDTVGIRIITGRSFLPRDQSNSPRVAILNETAARFYFGADNPLGRKISLPGQNVTSEYEIVGLSADARYESLREPAERMIYLPITQAVDRITNLFLAIRTNSALAKALIQPTRKTVSGLVPGGFVTNIASIDEQIDSSLVQERLVSMLASLFGGLALSLACIGIYGIMAYSVIRRTREIGIRIALGARRSSVVWLVARQTVLLIVSGLAFGVTLVLATTRFIESELYGLEWDNAGAIGAAAIILVLVAAAATYLPIRKATRVDPTIALRYE
jgi:predicted permease